eukprot:s3383_g3.t1
MSRYVKILFSPGPHCLSRAIERSETVSGSASCSTASPMPKSLGKGQRRRAPPCHRDLDPKMCCPRGPLTEAVMFADPLMLCGPSELSGLERRRKYLQIDQMVEQKRPKVPALLAMEEVLRLKLRIFDQKLGGGMLKALVGRMDLAQHILSFLNSDRPLVDTAVGGKMFADSGSANVDLFFHSVPSMPSMPSQSKVGRPSRKVPLEEMLEKAWEENPEVCLKQIFLIGSAREGKQDRYSFYEALQWLWWKDPATVLANLHHVPECNYWKALLEFLARLCEGPQRSKERDRALLKRFERCNGGLSELKSKKILMADAEPEEVAQGPGSGPGDLSWCPGSRLELAEEALKRYEADPLYRCLLERTGQLFATQLREDLRKMKRGEQVSLCAKWCPWLNHSFDRRTLICESIARWLFPPSEFPGNLTERHYAFRARDRLRKVLGELKEYMKLGMESADLRVHATCLSLNAPIFEKRDPERFQSFLQKLLKRKGKVNVGALQPHELLKKAIKPSSSMEKMLVQAQWRSLVNQVRSSGCLSNCIAVCDVSGSMYCPAASGGTLLVDVAIAMSLLLAQVAQGPTSRQLITFSESPRLVTLPETEDLAELYRFVQGLDWGQSTNFHKVFELLKSKVPKQVFVFSDMQFAEASGDHHAEPVLRKMQKEYEKLKLELPELVFWNLAADQFGAPALANDSGVVLMSGFSAQMIKSLMDPEADAEVEQMETCKGKKKKEKRDPLTAMCAALQKPLFQQLRVIYDQQEAMDLFQVPKSPANSFQVQLPPEKMVKTYQKLPQNTSSLHLGRVEKEAMRAFIRDLRGLRGEMRQQLAQFLRKSGEKVKFKFRLEVNTPQPQWRSHFKIRQPLGTQSGEVEATLTARLPVEHLQQALDSIAHGHGQWKQRKRQGSGWTSPRKVSKSSERSRRKRRL